MTTTTVPPPALDLSLYLVTDSTMLPSGATVESQVEAALAGGVTLVQLREKTLDTGLFVERAKSIKAICARHGVPLLINDRVDVALAADADGVHIGQDDMDAAAVRALLGPHKILGVTVHTVADAVRAAAAGASYLGTCAVFATATKPHPAGFEPLGVVGVKGLLAAIADHPQASSLPVCAIGGLGVKNAAAVAAESAGPRKRLAGIAVVSAIMAQHDAKAASAALRAALGPALKRADAYVDFSVAGSSSPSVARKAVEAAAAALDAMRAGTATPLVHHLTNLVVMNDNANAALAVGGSPVMAHAIQEMDAMVGIASSLVINVGTLSEQWIESMVVAGKAANKRGIPVILDPVGAGATPYRLETCKRLLTEIQFTVIKGNASEIGALAGLMGATPAPTEQQRGVDSAALAGGDATAAALARALAAATSATVAMSGATDYVASPSGNVVAIENGTSWLGKITGTGCTTATLVGCVAGVVGKEEAVAAAVGGILIMCIAGEKAVAEARGPMSFKIALFDALASVTGADLKRMALVRDV
ncbi:Hydroxyethylthiazole kinase family-domain-containing protein [Blastocladiella britannica]|nr:Hydroxyethylthiazole kinase family-domain-containing protein [Blastocladiella britannica]